jgi:GGDEF domain-containing protein
LLAAVHEPFSVAPEQTAAVGISVGVALSGRDGTADELLGRADAALYEAKRGGGRRVSVSGG